VSLPAWPFVFAVAVSGMRSSLHAHHAWQLMVGLDGPVRFQAERGAAPVAATAVLTHPNVPHAAEADAGRVAVVFVHPESEVGARLRARGGSGNEVLDDDVADLMRRALRPARSRDELIRRSAHALAALEIGDAAPPLRHRGVRRVLRRLRGEAPLAETSLAALAELSGLSPSRFMHVFTAEVGIPLRPYLRWLKLERATLALGAGASQAEAAHAAGFADAAHMARSFRAMLGTTPSTLRRSQSVQAESLLGRAEFRPRAEEIPWNPSLHPSGPAAS
jgi:AraC-like DNA-binding protein